MKHVIVATSPGASSNPEPGVLAKSWARRSTRCAERARDGADGPSGDGAPRPTPDPIERSNEAVQRPLTGSRTPPDPARWVPLTLTVVVGVLLWFGAIRSGSDERVSGSERASAPGDAAIAPAPVSHQELLWLELPEGVTREEVERHLLEFVARRGRARR